MTATIIPFPRRIDYEEFAWLAANARLTNAAKAIILPFRKPA